MYEINHLNPARPPQPSSCGSAWGSLPGPCSFLDQPAQPLQAFGPFCSLSQPLARLPPAPAALVWGCYPRRWAQDLPCVALASKSGLVCPAVGRGLLQLLALFVCVEPRAVNTAGAQKRTLLPRGHPNCCCWTSWQRVLAQRALLTTGTGPHPASISLAEPWPGGAGSGRKPSFRVRPSTRCVFIGSQSGFLARNARMQGRYFTEPAWAVGNP